MLQADGMLIESTGKLIGAVGVSDATP